MNKLTISLLGVVIASPAFAQIDDTLRLRYADNTELQLGVGVDEAETSKARQFCLDFDAADIVPDVSGATDAEIVTRAIFDTRDFENDFKFDYSFNTTATAGVDKLFNTTSTLKNTGKFELFSTLLYLVMGWLIVFDFSNLSEAIGPNGVLWLFAGGLSYTVGIIFYAIQRIPYNHVIWHMFVLGGAICHFFMIFNHVI